MLDRAEPWRWGSLRHWQHQPAQQSPLLSPWPIRRLPGWAERVNTPLSEPELAAVWLSAQRGRPLGDADWAESIAGRLNLESTIRPRARQQHRFPNPPSKRPDPFAFPSPTRPTAWGRRLGRVDCRSAQSGIDHPSPCPPTASLPQPPIKEA